MKPVGLDNPHSATPEFPRGRWPYAVVQLRQDNKLGTLWNMVGFQTKLKHAEQVRLFRTIPGLENAEFARLGGLHRNTFLNSPTLLDRELRLKSRPHIRFAGQITGCEGYVESASVGLLAGLMTAHELAGRAWTPPPRTTALGALLAHITGDAEAESYQPMNVNFGLFPPVDAQREEERAQGGVHGAGEAGFGSGWWRGLSPRPARATAQSLRLTHRIGGIVLLHRSACRRWHFCRVVLRESQ
jgi:methylenetetrahydrofolate--tRNA-(uracil-5-)-methyltransferase